ncbi:MAG: fatty acid desaturase [Ginsengibacter sp.]
MKTGDMRSVIHHPYNIPAKINLAILVMCSVLYFVLLYASSHCSTSWIFLYGFLFAIVMIPVYSLIHEAEHNILLPDTWWNNFLGRWLCCMFIVSFSFFRHCHLRHHKKNRTDIEMWELYYEHQVKWKRYGNLYLMMSGLAYLSLWLSVFLFSFAPSLLHIGFLQKHTEIAGFLEGCNQKEKTNVMRWESLLVIGFQIAIFYLLHLHFMPWLILFLIHGFVWSSQNYVNHAFSPRDIINGAHNLKMPLWLKPVYLNFNVHLAHHQNPRIPWILLPGFIRKDPHRIGFFRNYLRLWKGPKLTGETDPLLNETYNDKD